MHKIIAELKIVCQYPNGAHHEGLIKIGEPYLDEGKWHTYVDADCVTNHKAPTTGVDSFQALCMAVDFARVMMMKFKEQDGAMIYRKYDGELHEFEVDNFFPKTR